MRVDWGWGVDTLWRGIDNFPEKSQEAIEEKIIDFGIKVLEYAKSNAPWDDRTGAAREGLDVDVVREDNKIGLSLFHTVDYGIWLEIRWGGRYAIILPTIEKLGPELMDELTNLITGITYYA